MTIKSPSHTTGSAHTAITLFCRWSDCLEPIALRYAGYDVLWTVTDSRWRLCYLCSALCSVH